MTPTGYCDDVFLDYVFPGGSDAAVRFRSEIQGLNLYCKRFKAAINCILLTGETGVGKNYTARGISAHSQWLTLTDDERHAFLDGNGQFIVPPTRLVDLMLLKQHRSSRKTEPKTVQRLATVLGPQLANELAASELFGHCQHAFTGALTDHPGIFGDDSVEDILLDEIADMSPNVQTKLLQFIESRTFRPVGGLAADERISEHRLFLATNRPLEEFVRQGKFREDLYWRIHGYRINIPPLRERRDNIRDIAYSVLASVNFRQRGEQTTGPSLAPEADRYCLLPKSEWLSATPTFSNWVVLLDEDDLQWCESYGWPGNIRELRQRLELYVFHNGHCRLRSVQPPHPDTLGIDSHIAHDQQIASLVSRAVQQYLSEVLSGAAPPPGQPKGLLSHFERLIKLAVYRFKSDGSLAREDLATVFPDARDAETTIGRWRSIAATSDNT